MKTLENKFVYVTGKPNNFQGAIDSKLRIPCLVQTALHMNDNTNNSINNKNDTINKYLKLERKVEIYDPISKLWEPIIIRGK